MHLLLRAATVAAEAHTGQYRRGLPVPYVNHPLRVAAHAANADLGVDAVIAALLHDVVEDTAWTWEQLEQLGFPDRSLDIARRLTKSWDDDTPEAEAATRKARYYAAIVEDSDALALKLLDRADNLGDILRIKDDRPEFAEDYLRKTHREFPPLVEACDNAYARRVFADALTLLERAFGDNAEAWS
jgi:(p)ppGpp synthase/HD superfamily hydrolase